MAPSKSTRSAASSRKSKSKLNTSTLDSFLSNSKTSLAANKPSLSHDSESTIKVVKPLKSLLKPPDFQLPGNGKEQKPASPQTAGNQGVAGVEEARLWVDAYAPETETDLAVHKKKVDDVRRWLIEAFDGGPTGVLRKYRRILALTGNAGTGKTATLQVLAREMNFDILEWRNSPDEDYAWKGDGDYDYDRESLTKKFQTFLTRASSCRPLPLFSNATSSSFAIAHSRQVILLEDLPNILHAGTAEAFHAALHDYIASPPSAPIVIIISDAGTRGEDPENDTMGGPAWGQWKKQAIDVRSVIPHTLFNSPYFQEIKFNPIASTIMLKALTTLLTKHFAASRSSRLNKPTKDTLGLIVEPSHGDIRSAIMGLQFACITDLPRGSKRGNMRNLLEATIRREQSLALFHMLGKVLYNKRKGDPSGPSATVKECEREQEIDSKICDPTPLPSHLEAYSRRSSRVDVNILYADSPVDTSLYALYLHQNYTQYCNEVDECDGICDWLSWIDASGPVSWQAQQNSHQFHIITLGTLQSLPSPVPRRSQRMFKPEFFDVLKRTRESEACVADTEEWVNRTITQNAEGGRRWGRDEVILELGGLLKALDTCGPNTPPRNHLKFTALSFVHPDKLPNGTEYMQQLEESEEATEEAILSELGGSARAWNNSPEDQEKGTGGWLETDDIGDF